MGKHKAISTDRLVYGLLLGTVASGLAAAALGSAGMASASCVSFNGMNNGTTGGSTCDSTPGNVAIALGTGATADSVGGSGSLAFAQGGVTNTVAVTEGSSNFAGAGGPNTAAITVGSRGIAIAQGSNVEANAGVLSTDVGNAAFNIANDPTPGSNFVLSGFGNGNFASNQGGTASTTLGNFINAEGNNNVGTTTGGAGNTVLAEGTSNFAFGQGGTNNFVFAFPTGRIAGETNQTGGSFINNIH